MVEQRKLLDVVSGKKNVSKASPGIRWSEKFEFGILSRAVHGSIVVNTANPNRCSPGSNPGRSSTNYIFLQRNWGVETMESGITNLRDGYVSLLLR